MGNSFENINYLLRTKKQIERKIFVETLHRLEGLLNISAYHYYGFGSIYFADFQLFHKYLNISKMTSIEVENDIEKRCEFNKPYGFINLEISDAKDYIPEIKWKDSVFIWLDYDTAISEEIVKVIKAIAVKAKPLDIFTISINAHPLQNSEIIRDFKKIFGDYLDERVSNKKYKKEFSNILKKIITEALKDGLRSNDDSRKYHKIFDYCYKDGADMYTFGCLFYDKDAEINQESFKEKLSPLNHLIQEDYSINIDCPFVTKKEQKYLDSIITIDVLDWIENKHIIPFGKEEIDKIADHIGISKEKIERYLMYYKYYPQFTESIY